LWAKIREDIKECGITPSAFLDFVGVEFDDLDDEEKRMMPLFIYPYAGFLVCFLL
jgi:hypothetical protein